MLQYERRMTAKWFSYFLLWMDLLSLPPLPTSCWIGLLSFLCDVNFISITSFLPLTFIFDKMVEKTSCRTRARLTHLPYLPPPQPTAETLRTSSCPTPAFSLLLQPLTASSGVRQADARTFPAILPLLSSRVILAIVLLLCAIRNAASVAPFQGPRSPSWRPGTPGN